MGDEGNRVGGEMGKGGPLERGRTGVGEGEGVTVGRSRGWRSLGTRLRIRE